MAHGRSRRGAIERLLLSSKLNLAVHIGAMQRHHWVPDGWCELASHASPDARYASAHAGETPGILAAYITARPDRRRCSGTALRPRSGSRAAMPKGEIRLRRVTAGRRKVARNGEESLEKKRRHGAGREKAPRPPHVDARPAALPVVRLGRAAPRRQRLPRRPLLPVLRALRDGDVEREPRGPEAGRGGDG